MKLSLCVLALCCTLTAQVPTSVKFVTAGADGPDLSRPHFVPSPVSPSPVKTGIAPVARKDQERYPSFEQYLAARSKQQASAGAPVTTAAAPPATDAWVRQYSPSSNDSTIDPATGMPTFSTSVTLRQLPSEVGTNAVPRFAAAMLRNFVFFLGSTQGVKTVGRK